MSTEPTLPFAHMFGVGTENCRTEGLGFSHGHEDFPATQRPSSPCLH